MTADNDFILGAGWSGTNRQPPKRGNTFQMNTKTKSLLILLSLWGLPLAANADFKPAVARLALDRDREQPGGTVQATYTFRSSGPSLVELSAFVHVVRPDGRHIGADFSPDLPATEWPKKGFVREGPFPIVMGLGRARHIDHGVFRSNPPPRHGGGQRYW